jgi:tetratricopeptide (TPR) repeat protein
MPARPAQQSEKNAARPLPIIWAIICLLMGAVSPPNLTAEVRLAADDQFRYAQSCFETQAYDCAIAEFRRFAHFFTDDPRVPQALLQMGRAQLLTGDTDGAIRHFETLMRRFEESPQAIQAAFLKTEAWARQGVYHQALLTLNNLILTTTDVAIQDRARFRSAWIHIDRGDWPAARSALRAITPANRAHYRTDTLLSDLDAAQQVPSRSPALAGSLSILPGLGQLYCERYEDALIAFLVNGGLIWAAVEAFDRKLYALGGVIGFVEAGFYAGNIYGAIGDAHKYNRRSVTGFKNDLKNRWRVGMLPAPQKDGIGLVLQLDY